MAKKTIADVSVKGIKILVRVDAGGSRTDRFAMFCLQHLYGSVFVTAPKSTTAPRTRAAIAAPVTPAAIVRRFNIDDAPTGTAWELLSEARRSASTLFESISIWSSLAIGQSYAVCVPCVLHSSPIII